MGTPVDDPAIKDRILAEIAAHVRVYGRERWELIRERPEFASIIGKEAGEVGKRKFFRWVNAVTAGERQKGDGVPSTHREGDNSQARAALDDAKKQALLAAQKNIPAAPSPAYIARAGAKAAENINFLAEVGELMRDARKMRAGAVKADETQPDGEKVLNWHLFGNAITHRLKIMDHALRVMQEIWDLNYQQRFYQEIESIIVDELAPFPEVQERVIHRLAELNQRRGMTIYADMS